MQAHTGCGQCSQAQVKDFLTNSSSVKCSANLQPMILNKDCAN